MGFTPDKNVQNPIRMSFLLKKLSSRLKYGLVNPGINNGENASHFHDLLSNKIQICCYGIHLRRIFSKVLVMIAFGFKYDRLTSNIKKVRAF